MRMPGMDGAELLEIIQKQYPHTIRIMLTGQADEQSVLRTVGVVHQFLAKPCDPELLKTILIQTAALQDILSDGALKDLISQIGALPSLPSTYDKLRRAVACADIDVLKVGKIIEEDLAMSAKVLHLVNSAFFGIYTKVNSPTRAVQLLGVDTIKALVLGLGIFTQMKAPARVLSLESLWLHSLSVGKMAKAIAIEEGQDAEAVSNAFLAGTLHDIGKLILVSYLPDKYEQAMLMAQTENIFLHAAEKNIFGTGQSAIGAYLIGLWGFSNQIIEAICFQSAPERYPATTFSPALAVHLANVLYYQNRPQEIIGRKPCLNMGALEALSLQDKVGEWQHICSTILQAEKES
jgi:HD-like signal output (HDOD) protein